MIMVAVGVETDSRGDVLVSRRPQGKHLAGVWEWPGGKVEATETPEEALRREWLEEVGVAISDLSPWTFAYHRYDERTVLLLFYRVRSVDRPSTSPEGLELRWVRPETLGDNEHPFPEANRSALAELRRQTK